MTTAEIITKLQQAFAELENTAETIPEAFFFQPPTDGKWSVADNLEHLFLSVKPLAGLFGKTALMQANWGRNEKGSRSYETLVAIYLDKLKTAAVTNNPFGPLQKQEAPSKEKLLSSLHSIHQLFVERAALLSEEELDGLQAPHPLLGLLTCREFLYFTHYHTSHHLKTIISL